MDRVALASAVREWSGTLGPAQVECELPILDAASTATFLTEQRVRAILRPGTRREVQECVRTANRFGVPVYPVSSGKNWGYGSRVPAGDGVLLDLGRLNGIVDFDEELAYVTIEPGVTQRQLHEFLLRAKLPSLDGCHRGEPRLQHHRQYDGTGVRSHADG